ncbi:MAG: long-chain fatty acid--CoA ligase, partial [Pseudomonadota bacterium]
YSTPDWLKSYPKNVDWRAEIPAKPLFCLLDEAENNYPDKIALDFLGKQTTYLELADKVRRFAYSLSKLGVTKGVKVGIFMPNCPQFIISYYAILKAGGTVVNYNPLYSACELKHQIEDSDTSIMITLSLKAIYPKLAECVEQTNLRKVIISDFQESLPLAKRMAFNIARKGDNIEVKKDHKYLNFADLLDEEDIVTPITIDPIQDISVLQYTGGTTGVPKAAVLTHANVYANTMQCNLWFNGLRYGEEIIVGALPLFHVFAMTTIMNLSIYTGSCILLHPRFDMKNILYDIHFKRPTLMPGVPTMFAAIANYKQIGKYDLTSLKMCISGGGPLPQEVKNNFEKIAGCKLIEGYGLSESSPVAAANPLFGLNKLGSIGMPVPQTIIDIRQIDNPHKILPVGEVGEICISGPQVMQGYLNKPKETEEVLKNGVLHTGDLGYVDEDGYFYVVDRLKEMIISGGYKIYPRNIEEILYRHPEVLEAAVIGVSHPERVQQPKAFIVKKEGSTLTESSIREHLKKECSAYALPHLIEFRDSLPKSIIGKILKKDLIAEEKNKSVNS